MKIREINNYIDEFDGNEGFVTIEFSLHRKDLHSFFNGTLPSCDKSIFGRWIAMECDTCKESHGEQYVHISLETFKTIDRMCKASNFIMMED